MGAQRVQQVEFNNVGWCGISMLDPFGLVLMSMLQLIHNKRASVEAWCQALEMPESHETIASCDSHATLVELNSDHPEQIRLMIREGLVS